SELALLTPREREVLAAMAEGRNNASVAEALFLTQRAVEKHINSIFAKLRLSGDQQGHPRVRAVLLYLSGQQQEPLSPASPRWPATAGRPPRGRARRPRRRCAYPAG